jgi:hypothetical protein
MALWQNALRKISAKVAAYAVKPEDFGTTFTNRGATASFTFTLPTVADLPAGWWCEFYGISASGFVVASAGSSDNIVALNDAGADTLTMTTTSLIIGAYVRMIWDGTSWLSIRGAGNTYTAA